MRETSLRVPAPSLIWVHGQWSGDMMIDGVPDVRGCQRGAAAHSFRGVHPAQGWRQDCAGAGRRHQRSYGQGTRTTHLGGHLLICVGDPRKGGILGRFRSWLVSFRSVYGAVDRGRGRGGAPAAQRGRTTSRPARIRRILDRPWERGKDVVVQVICCLPGENVCGRRRCACRRPALSGSTDNGPAT